MRKLILLFGSLSRQQIFYKIKHFFLPRLVKKNNALFDQGVVNLDQLMSQEFTNHFANHKKFENYDFVSKNKPIEKDNLIYILNELNKKGILKQLSTYLGENFYCTEYHVVTLGNQKSTEGSMQPHHDYKGRRIKLYIWLDECDKNTHPLYFKLKSHLDYRLWDNYASTRMKTLKEDMTPIYGKIGDVTIFDTNGIHSNIKTTTGIRSVIKLTFENFGLFYRLSSKRKNGKDYLKKTNSIKVKNLFNQYS